MKRFIFCVLCAVICLVTYKANYAYASGFPSYEILDEGTTTGQYGFIWAQEELTERGVTDTAYPYKVYVSLSNGGRNYSCILLAESPIYIGLESTGVYSLAPLNGTFYKSVVYGNNVRDFNSEALRLVGENIKIHSEYNITDRNGVTFFPASPVPIQKTELGAITEEALQKKSPIIQVISLLPLVIFLVASFLGLRKCLQMLRTLLSKA